MLTRGNLRDHFRDMRRNTFLPKVGYDTLEEAIKEGKRFELIAYSCNVCGKYHVGRTRNKRKRKK